MYGEEGEPCRGARRLGRPGYRPSCPKTRTTNVRSFATDSAVRSRPAKASWDILGRRSLMSMTSRLRMKPSARNGQRRLALVSSSPNFASRAIHRLRLALVLVTRQHPLNPRPFQQSLPTTKQLTTTSRLNCSSRQPKRQRRQSDAN
jgi:hypothetical protein